MKGKIVAGLAALCVIMAAASGSYDPEADAAKAADPPTDPALCNEAWSTELYDSLTRLGVVRGADVSAQRGVVVVVEPRSWNRMDLDAQKTLAAAVDCAIARDGKHLTGLRFRTNLDGEDLMKLSSGELLDLRQAGLARGDAG